MIVLKKLTILILTLLLTVALCSCSFVNIFVETTKEEIEEVQETVQPYLEIVPDEVTYNTGYTPVVSDYAYRALPLEGEQELYDKLLDVCYDIAADKDEEADRYPMPQIMLEGCSLSEAQVRTSIKALTDDHPEIFWLTGTIGYFSGSGDTVIQAYSCFSPQEVDTRVSAMRAAENAFYQTVPDDLSAFDRELMVHDFLIANVAYDENVDIDNPQNNEPDIYNAYGALVNKVAVCEGYARAFQMLMNGIGVHCVGIVGKSENQMHMWNAVLLDEDWYHIDVTWDDQEKDYAKYVFFNLNDESILEDHEISPLFDTLSDDEINGVSGEYSSGVMNNFVPECTATAMGYYAQKAPRLSDYEDETFKSELLRCAENKDEHFVFYVDEGLDYATAISQLFETSPQYFFSYMNAVNNTLPDYSIDTSNASYIPIEKCRAVVVVLHYY